MVVRRNTEVVAGIYDALARGDIDAATRALDPDIEWVEPDTPGLYFAGTHQGVEAVARTVFSLTAAAWDEFRAEVDELLGDGEAVVALGRFVGRAGDRRLDAPFAHVWRVRGGLAAEMRDFTDTAAFLTALGAPVA
jgi:ketosteroid isomerase-like protein